MDNQIFRKKSMDRISSPEQLNDYLRVANPGVWMILAALLVLLAGVCVWGVFGHMDTKMSVCVASEGQGAVCYVHEDEITQVSAGMPLVIGDAEYALGALPGAPMQVDDSLDAYILHVGGFVEGDWAYAIPVEGAAPEGIYGAEIILESVSPISFILN